MLGKAHLLDIVSDFRNVLERRPGILKSFCRHGVQIEGWLKGEILHLLDTKKAEGALPDFDREVAFGQGRRRIDLKLTGVNDGDTWIELKHWLIGYQKGTRYSAGFYFGDPSSVGIRPDVEKLQLARGHKFIMVLATANPGADGWRDGIETFNRKFSPLQVNPLTDPTDFPEYYFLGLLSTHGGLPIGEGPAR